jgi:hypothetical protein
MVALQLKKHGGTTDKRLTAIPAGDSTRKSLAEIGDPEIDGTLARTGSAMPRTRIMHSAGRTGTQPGLKDVTGAPHALRRKSHRLGC